MRIRSTLLASSSAWCSASAALSIDSFSKASAVKDAYRYAWQGYLRCAFPGDTADTLTCAEVNDRGGWGVTAIDGLSTALIMGLTDIAEVQIDHVMGVDYKKSGNDADDDGVINGFETTIRTLGGLLSAHDLLRHGYARGIADADSKALVLALQAQELADTLSPLFGTKSGLPAAALNLTTKPPSIYEDPEDLIQVNSVAAIGTSQVEYARLSEITGISKYVDRSVAAARKLFTVPKQATLKPLLKGMLGRTVDVTLGILVNDQGGWGARIDSYYEYLLKMFIYDPSKYRDFLQQYKVVVSSTVENLISHPKGFPAVTLLAAHNGTEPEFNGQHLACFAGGNLLQSSRFINDTNVAALAEELIHGCDWVYKNTAAGLAPEEWSWIDEKKESRYDPPNPDQQQYFSAHGFWPKDGSQWYGLRPEHVESLFYGWRITRDQKYRDWAWDAFLAINATATQYGYVPIIDVTVKEKRTPESAIFGRTKMESFFFAETLKYLYLIFAEFDEIPLSDWVFNTEAHPLRIKAKDEDQTPFYRCFTDAGCADLIHIPRLNAATAGTTAQDSHAHEHQSSQKKEDDGH